jgi:hypothetical protein
MPVKVINNLFFSESAAIILPAPVAVKPKNSFFFGNYDNVRGLIHFKKSFFRVFISPDHIPKPVY